MLLNVQFFMVSMNPMFFKFPSSSGIEMFFMVSVSHQLLAVAFWEGAT